MLGPCVEDEAPNMLLGDTGTLGGGGELIEDLWIISLRLQMGLWDPSFFLLPFVFLPGHEVSFALSSAPALCPAVPLPEVSTDVETSAGTSKSPNQKMFSLHNSPGHF